MRFVKAVATAAVCCALAGTAQAVPTTVTHVDTSRCDPLVVPTQVHELGRGAGSGEFPAEEAIASGINTPGSFTACAETSGGLTDFHLRIVNLTSTTWSELWYVADPESSISNLDGLVNNMPAFRIDNVGVNRPLSLETGAPDGLFQPGEGWFFWIQDYSNSSGLPADSIGSIGVPSPGNPRSSGSIIAVVPEPATWVLTLLAVVGLVAGRRSMRVAAAVVVLLCSVLPGTAQAVPTTVTSSAAGQCDTYVVPTEVHELGNPSAPPFGPAGPFPADESIGSAFVANTVDSCFESNQTETDLLIRIVNLTGIPWGNLWYVADPETTITNVDALINGMRAFRIDAVNFNTPLSLASADDEIFAPGEAWDFVLQDYSNSLGLPAFALGSIGVPSAGNPLSSGSIIAVAVPEPASSAVALLGMAGLVGAARIRRRAQRTQTMRSLHAAVAALLCSVLAGTAQAVPTTVTFSDTPECDPLSVPTAVHELGTFVFPPGELILAGARGPDGPSVCAPDGPGGNWILDINNVTGVAWRSVWYVADPETTLSNVDGLVNGMRAFRIDGVGANTPLIFESGGPDGVFMPGELWRFVIQDYTNSLGSSHDRLGSIGVPSPGSPTSSGSIIAVAVPEPASSALALLGMAGLVGAALIRRRAQRTQTTRSLHAAVAALLCSVLAGTAQAVPTTITSSDTPECDPLVVPTQVHELGFSPFFGGAFPAEEAISSNVVGNLGVSCSATNSAVPDQVIFLFNLTGISWRDLWYVADPETTITNVDGLVNGMRAFKIDNVGANRPLLLENGVVDGIFAPGEGWVFSLQDYVNSLGTSPSAFGSIGVPSAGNPLSSGSIIAVVPEPTSSALALLGIVGIVTAARTRRGAQRAE